MNMEDRLRALYTERTEREPLPGPDTEESLDRLLTGEIPTPTTTTDRSSSNVWRLPIRPLALAAAVLAVCAIAGLLVVQADEDNAVSTEDDKDRPDRPDPTPPPTTQPPTTSSPPTSTTDTTVTPPPSASGTTVVVGPHGPLGWWDGTRWVQAERGVAPPVAGGEQYQIVSMDAPITTAVGGWGDGCEIGDEPGTVVDVGIRRREDGAPAVAVTGVPNARPRPVRILSPAGGGYKAAAVDVLAGLGIDDPNPTIAEVLEGDLDGDGTNEVLVIAERITQGPDGYVPTGDNYAVAFLRRVVGGAVQTTVIEESRAQRHDLATVEAYYMEFLRFAALADLNGDGRMEVVLDVSYYEGSALSVYELQTDGSLREVLTGGCGA